MSALLGPPNEDGPVVVRAAFHLRDINDIDDEAETFEFTGPSEYVWTLTQDGERVMGGTYERR